MRAAWVPLLALVALAPCRAAPPSAADAAAAPSTPGAPTPSEPASATAEGASTTARPAKKTAVGGKTKSHPPPRVWFTPNEGSVDLLDLFRHPDRWAEARAQIDVFKFYTGQVGSTRMGCKGSPRCGQNHLDNLVAVDAFQQLDAWGIAIAAEAFYPDPVPDRKTGQCITGPRIVDFAVTVTKEIVDNIERSGARVAHLAIDEPVRKWYPEAIHFAQGVKEVRPCLFDSMAPLADEVASYVAKVRAAHPGVDIGQVELYPEVGLEQLKQWIVALEERGAKLSFLHLDLHGHRLDAYRKRGLKVDVARDLRELEAFLHARDMALGVIFTDIRWQSGLMTGRYDDAAYASQTMDLLRFVHEAIGTPDDAIFQSWVPTPDRRGPKTIPDNLPGRGADGSSHTEIVLEGISVLRSPD